MKIWTKLNINQRLLLLISIVVSLVITATVGFSLYRFNNYALEEANSKALIAMDVLEEKLNSYADQAKDKAGLLGANPAIVSAVRSANTTQLRTLADILSREGSFDMLTVTDANGTVLARLHDQQNSGDNIRNQPGVQQALNGRATTAIETGEETKLSVCSGIPIQDDNRAVIGSLLLCYSLEKTDILDDLKTVVTADLTLFQGDLRVNTTIVHDGNRLVGTRLDPTIANLVLNQNQRYLGRADILGVPYVTSYMPMRGRDNRTIGVIFAGIPIQQISDAQMGVIWVVVGLSVVAIGLFIVFIKLSLNKLVFTPLHTIKRNMDNADLNTQFNSTNQDEIGELTRSFDSFVTSMRDILIQVSESSSSVSSASSEISSSTEQMAAGAQEQTLQAGEVASAVEEMTKTIVENSKNASSTAEQMKAAKQAAQNGVKISHETRDAIMKIVENAGQVGKIINELGGSSEQIGDIITVIDDIADQTNLLALNAAIEAARAGEQGRGFAVVADEVRKLAERTTKATQEISDLIKKIQNDTGRAVQSMGEAEAVVNEGSEKTNKTTESLEEIVRMANEVSDMVSQIAAASEQQSSASEQISKNVEAISSVTQETASGTEQVARTAEDLNRLTENLQELVNRFKLDSGDSFRTHRQGSIQQKKDRKQEEKSRSIVGENGYVVEAE